MTFEKDGPNVLHIAHTILDDGKYWENVDTIMIMGKRFLDADRVREVIEKESARVAENASHAINVSTVTPQMESWRKIYMERFANGFPNAVKKELGLLTVKNMTNEPIPVDDHYNCGVCDCSWYDYSNAANCDHDGWEPFKFTPFEEDIPEGQSPLQAVAERVTAFQEQFPSVRQADCERDLIGNNPLAREFMMYHFLDKQRVREVLDANLPDKLGDDIKKRLGL